jgi:hypothetical protein
LVQQLIGNVLGGGVIISTGQDIARTEQLLSGMQNKIVQVYVSEDVHKALIKAASESNIPVGTYLRRLAVLDLVYREYIPSDSLAKEMALPRKKLVDRKHPWSSLPDRKGKRK